MLYFLIFVALGAAVGWVATSVLGSKLTVRWGIIWGIAGGLIGGLIATLFSFAAVPLFKILLSIVGAGLVLYYGPRFFKSKS